MWYSFLIAICICLALLAYFAISRKLKTPTITTEILYTKYNKRLEKLKRFLAKNKISFNESVVSCQIEKSEISLEKIQENVETIKKIEKNNDIIEEVFIASSKDEVMAKLSTLEKDCKIHEFAGEIAFDSEVELLFGILGYTKTKLDFEKQRYFGSQFFYKIESNCVFVNNSLALILDEKNVFDCKFVKFDKKIELISRKTKANPPIYNIKLMFGEKIVETKLSVPQDEVKKVLDKMIKNQKN